MQLMITAAQTPTMAMAMPVDGARAWVLGMGFGTGLGTEF